MTRRTYKLLPSPVFDYIDYYHNNPRYTQVVAAWLAQGSFKDYLHFCDVFTKPKVNQKTFNRICKQLTAQSQWEAQFK